MRGAQGADAIDTDGWTSMGQKTEHTARLKAFDGLGVTPRAMGQAYKDALFLHCLPAHQGETVDAAAGVDGAQSPVFDQAENRLHAQKALMLYLLGKL